MDGARFDDLTRSLAGAQSRRRLLKGLAGGAVAAAWAGWRPGRSDAAPKVRVCHLTDSATNSVVLIEINAKDVPDHAAHGDVIAPDFANDPANCGGCLISCDDGDPCT